MDGHGLNGSSFCSPIVKADNETDVALDCIIGRSSVLFVRLIFHILPGWGESGRCRFPIFPLQQRLGVGGLASSCECFLCWCLFFTTRQESPLVLRTADRSLCRRSKHFTRSIVWSPVALLLHPICITALSGVEDRAPFASTICDEFGI